MPRLRGLAAETDELVIAVPKGALYEGALDLLDALGRDTSEVRANERKQLFPESALMTMRPADIVTYVEAGVADAGITGKDVLMESSGSGVYEVADLGFGACRMVLATLPDEPNPVDEAVRHVGSARIATKYPLTTQRYGEKCGTQFDIVEVKGSVEIAPVVNLVDGIVDLTATGRSLRENGLIIRDVIAPSTARLIVNPVSYGAKGEALRELRALLEERRSLPNNAPAK